MLSLNRACAALLACGLIATACAPGERSPVAPPSVVVQPTRPPSTPLPTQEPLSSVIPAIQSSNDSGQLLVISSLTGKALDAYKPIKLGAYYNFAFSPDGRTLALITNSQLDLIDLRSWTYRASDVNVHGWLSAAVYSPDGQRLAMATGYKESELRIVDAHSGAITASATLDFSVRNIQFASDQKEIMVFGPRADGNGVSTGSPVAALFAVSDLSRLWSVDLKGIRDGVFPRNPRTPNIYQPGASFYYSPAVLFAPGRDMLYIVHGNEDKLTVVDFGARKARTLAIRPKLSLLDRLLSLTAGVARAKGMDGTSKQGAISPDGKTLYVVALTEAYTQDSSGNWNMTTTHGGLQEIAARDGTILRHTDTAATSLAMSSDARHLYLTGWDEPGYSTGWSEVYDMASEKILLHMDSIQLTPTRHLDGSLALASTDGYGSNLCRMSSVDPATWTVIGSWKGRCLGWLTDP
ncbi:MAG: YncE family protein [Anaerolineae bacterium]